MMSAPSKLLAVLVSTIVLFFAFTSITDVTIKTYEKIDIARLYNINLGLSLYFDAYGSYPELDSDSGSWRNSVANQLSLLEGNDMSAEAILVSLFSIPDTESGTTSFFAVESLDYWGGKNSELSDTVIVVHIPTLNTPIENGDALSLVDVKLLMKEAIASEEPISGLCRDGRVFVVRTFGELDRIIADRQTTLSGTK